MGEEKPDTLDFVKDFQEYLSQQTQHVNMISGSVSGVKEADELPADCSQNGLDHPAVDISLEDGSGMLVDGFERTSDGKLKCLYCNYATRGTARLVEHIRMHTGEKPHRCHLCPFASAYERHLEAHMRSHTGEKPYKCELCSFRCGDRSNLSHHRRRRHKVVPKKDARSLSHKKLLSALQKKSNSFSYGRRLLIASCSSSATTPPACDAEERSREDEAYEDGKEELQSRLRSNLIMDNPLNQLSALAGQCVSLPSSRQPPASPGAESIADEKPLLIQRSSSSPISPERRAPSQLSNCSPAGGPSSGRSSATSSQPGTPGQRAPSRSPQHAPHHCQHCDVFFPDNILYTIHMGCHGYENPFQCNICGHKCRSKYDFACHFARGQHK
ncbi:zinc finger protein Pegasus [Syngnathus scovelli]|uniref:zinc finger protein Pegasus n=1 Tax=Syngnathus scovelli TaxID=161590 RepID=UPI002110726E|nr:zinc finger protein Pegasus [Syngnathus scovelli]XP_049592024.1 zinc finger protein Pegasus [Syngnathus scovelli]XP_049592025.1 zinc finger protein Pegasus [Syngnathus scovelli]